jgi:hypothetical protein
MSSCLFDFILRHYLDVEYTLDFEVKDFSPHYTTTPHHTSRTDEVSSRLTDIQTNVLILIHTEILYRQTNEQFRSFNP